MWVIAIVCQNYSRFDCKAIYYNQQTHMCQITYIAAYKTVINPLRLFV